MEDQKIIELIKNKKDEKAIASLYDYFPVITKMVLANGGKSEDAQDIFQEALIVFYNKANQSDFKLTSSINTYLYSVCKFMWQKQIRDKKEFVDTTMLSESVNEEEIVSEIEFENKCKQAEQAISELGEKCKQLLMLFYFKSMKLKDIAKQMGYTSENIAKSQRYKCLEAAKKKLITIKKDI